MKKKILFGAIIGLLMFSFHACNNNSKPEPDTDLNECTRYACPIHPDKTSATQEKCPQCDTTMVLLTDSAIKDAVKQFKQINK